MSTSSVEDEGQKDGMRDKFRGEKNEGGHASSGSSRSAYEPSNKKFKRDWPNRSYTMMTSYVPPNKNNNLNSESTPISTSTTTSTSTTKTTSSTPLSYDKWLETSSSDFKRKASSSSDLHKSYEAYKKSVVVEACEEFFEKHKEEPWFKSNYMPGERQAREAERQAVVMQRKKAFMTLVDAQWIDDVSLEVGRNKHIVKILDAVVILLEGGSVEDLKVLDREEVAEKERPSVTTMPVKFTEPLRLSESLRMDFVKPNDVLSESGSISDSDDELNKASTTPINNNNNTTTTSTATATTTTTNTTTTTTSTANATSSVTNDETTSNATTVATEVSNTSGGGGEELKTADDDASSLDNVVDGGAGGGSDDGKAECGAGNDDGGDDDDVTKMEENEDKEESGGDGVKVNGGKDGDGDDTNNDKGDDDDDGVSKKNEVAKKDGEEGDDDDDDDGMIEETTTTTSTTSTTTITMTTTTTSTTTTTTTKKERLLHKTVSLFVRGIPVSACKEEIQELFSGIAGFLRLALQDPRPETDFKTRSGWVTFENWVNVKDLCWNMRDLKLQDKPLSVTVNSDLKQRLRGINGLTSHKPVAKEDVKTIVKIIQYLDALYGVWEDGDVDKETLGFVSSNPLLKNITEHLVEEGSYEEEALLIKAGAYWDEYEEDKKRPAHAEVFIEQDPVLLKALDRLILYLRVVHSFDYYVSSDYTAEACMPHLCGIMHVREPAPLHKVTQAHLDEWQQAFEAKVAIYAEGKLWKSADEMKEWSKKEEEEIEKFIKANTQELSSDKWLCPLSGKKFKGADFVRKHILTKHQERLQAVKMEVEYFNNYMRDNRRPQLVPPPPAHPLPISHHHSSSSSAHQGMLHPGLQTGKYQTPSQQQSVAAISSNHLSPHHSQPHQHRFNPYSVPRFPSFSSSVRKPVAPMVYHQAYRAPMNAPEMHHGGRMGGHARPVYRIPGDTYRPRDKFVPRRGRS